MISFYEMKRENGVFTALAVNNATKQEFRIVASLDGSYINTDDYYFKKATWGVIARYENKKMPKKTTAAWG